MNSDQVVKLLEDIGLNRPVNEEDFSAFQDYFAEQDNSSDESSDDGESKQLNPTQPQVEDEDVGNISDISLLRDVPRLEDVENLADLVNIADIVIEIDQNDDNNDAVVVDVEDEGQNVIVEEGDGAHVLGTFNRETDRQGVDTFLQTGCGCKDTCSNKFEIDRYIEMRLEAAELDYYENHTNLLDQVILGQLHCMTSDSATTNRKNKINAERKQNKTTYFVKGEKVCKNTCFAIK